MESEREAFLNAIETEPQNYLHREVYADWLDERGEHDEANRQRNFREADTWMRAFAERAGLPYELIVQAGFDYDQAAGGGWLAGFFPNNDIQDSYYLNSEMSDADVGTFWIHWRTITGRTVTLTGNPFVCGC